MSITERFRLFPGAPPLPPDVGRAAVAAIFGPDDELLFIHRAERKGDLWSGHMAFPGGRAESGDPSLQATAERETREEIGLDLSIGVCLGTLDAQLSPRNTPGKQLAVTPWVFRLPYWPELTLNGEVASVSRFAFERFIQGEQRGTFPYTWQGVELDLPCVRLEGTLLWGMTLRMVDDLVEMVVRR